jgi:branched-chain amino acid transport system substrate-binding protein
LKRRRLFVAAVVAMGLVALACQNQKAGPTTSTSANGCRKPAALGTANDFKLSAAHQLAQASASPTASAMTDASPTPSAMASASPTPGAGASVAPAESTPIGSSSTKKVVKLGFLGDLTGGNAGLVVSAEKSAKLAIDEANQAGDLQVMLQLDAKDNKDGAADTAPALAQQLIGDPSVVGVIGPAFSGETKATGALFCEAGLTDITQSATNPALTQNGWPTFFRALATDAVQGGQTGAYIVKGLGKKNVAVINDKSDYGTGLAEAVAKSVTQNGGTVVLNQGIEPTTDYTTVVDSVIAKKPDVLYYAGYDKDAPLLIKQYRQKGGTALVMGGDGDKGTNLLKEGGASVEGAILTCPCLDPNASSDTAAQKFASDYRRVYGEDAGIYSAEAWDVANIFIAAIKAAGTNPTRKSVLDYVTNLKDYKGLSKTFNWTSTHEVVGGDITFVYKVVGGKYTLLGKAADLSGGASSSASPSATP